MSTVEPETSPTVGEQTRRQRLSIRMADYGRRAEAASEAHASVAVPFRAARRNTKFAASALSGGFAYRLFFWLLPFGLFVGGVLGLGNADSPEDALAQWGIPGLVVDSLGDAARSSGSSRWWIAAISVPALIWAGYTGTKALVLIHGLIWDDPPKRLRGYLRASLGFTGILVAFMAVIGVTDWLREDHWSLGLITAVLMTAPLVGMWLWVSLLLPHRGVSWKMLLPGALLFGIGIELLHIGTSYVLLPKLEHSSQVYGAAGYTSTILFWMYLAGRLVITAPILNSSLHDEYEERRADDAATASVSPE